MKNPDFPEAFLKRLESITQKRARVVIDHILQHGYITTEEEDVRQRAQAIHEPMPDYVKAILRKHLED
jgi:predicted O-methyltransferase YrrM